MLCPKFTVSVTCKLLSTPSAAAKSKKLPSHFQRQTIRAAAGEISLYRVGQGPLVVLSHGWSGNAAQFKGLMQQLASAGYTALAFDHYGHGSSGGGSSDYLLFVQALEVLRRHFQEQQTEVHAVVGHSIGGSASLQVFNPCKVPHLLISPVIGVYQRFRLCALEAGFSESVFDAAVAAIESLRGRRFIEFDENSVLKNRAVKVHLLHSKKDRIVPLHSSVAFQATATHLGISVAKEGGHSSILNQCSTSALLLSWLSQVAQNDFERPQNVSN